MVRKDVHIYHPQMQNRVLKNKAILGHLLVTFITMQKRVALYARVSTKDKSQNPEVQLRQLREYAEIRNMSVAHEYVDYGSGKDDRRLQFQQLLKDAKRRKFDVVMVWRYDRFARSTIALVNALSEFDALGIDFISLQEGQDTTTPQGKLLFTIAAGFAQFESDLIATRVRAGMAAAKAKGGHMGRPSLSPEKIRKIKALRKKKMTYRKIAQEVGVTHPVAMKYSKL
jgi:DNA invertase Pin-like site-specific DNA recombinase